MNSSFKKLNSFIGANFSVEEHLLPERHIYHLQHWLKEEDSNKYGNLLKEVQTLNYCFFEDYENFLKEGKQKYLGERTRLVIIIIAFFFIVMNFKNLLYVGNYFVDLVV